MLVFLLLSPCSVRKTCTFSMFLSPPPAALLHTHTLVLGPGLSGSPSRTARGRQPFAMGASERPIRRRRSAVQTHPPFPLSGSHSEGPLGCRQRPAGRRIRGTKTTCKNPKSGTELTPPMCAKPVPAHLTQPPGWKGGQRPVMKPPSLSEGTSSTTSPLAYLLPKNVSSFCLFLT